MRRLCFTAIWTFVAFLASGFVTGIVVFFIFLLAPHEPAHRTLNNIGLLLAAVLVPAAIVLGLCGYLPGTSKRG